MRAKSWCYTAFRAKVSDAEMKHMLSSLFDIDNVCGNSKSSPKGRRFLQSSRGKQQYIIPAVRQAHERLRVQAE
jgi:hypothetical protein